MKKVLIADDDPFMEKLLQFTLKKVGYSITVCREGYSVLPRVSEEKPSLIILDYMLPGRSGLELIEDLKQDSTLSGIPVIFVTGQGKESTRKQLLSAGASEVFTKPFSPTALVSIIQKLTE